MTPTIPHAHPAGAHGWDDDEPGLPDALRLSPAAVAERAEQRARIDAALRDAPPLSAPVDPARADPATDGSRRTRRSRRRPRATINRAATARAEFESAAWPAFAPPALGTASGPMAEVMAAERALATATASRARALTALADDRPATGDRPAGTPGAMSADRRAARPSVLGPVSEWVVRELRVSLAVTDHAADRMLVQALTLTRRLPGVLAALDGGLIHCGHLPAVLELLDPITDDTLRARIEAELLRWLATRGAASTITTPAQLRAKIHRVLLARDARTHAENLRRALATRGVFTSTEPVAGMSGLHVRLTTAEAAALYAALDQLVDLLPDDTDPERTRAEKMADVLLDLVLRPGSTTLPSVQVSLTVVAALETLLGGDTPGDINGHLVPAAQIRALLDLLTGTHLAADEPTDSEPTEPEATEPEPTEPESTDGSSTAHTPSDATVMTTSTTVGTSTTIDPVHALTGYAEPPPLDDATYWAMVDRLIANAPDADDLWWCPDDPVLPDDDMNWPDDGADPHPSSPHDEQRTGHTPARTTPSAATASTAEAALPTTQNALDAVAHAETVHSRLHAALRAADTALADAQTAAAHDEDDWRTGSGHLDSAVHTLDALRAAAPANTAALHDLLAATHTTTSGGLTHRPRIALTHALTGALISLTDLAGLRTVAGAGNDLGAPPDTDGYRPAAGLDRHIRTRDRRCRTPGCRRAVMTGQLDHHVPHPGGPTSAGNLCGLCLTDHRGKHQAPGWQHHLHPDGTYTVTTPAGLTARTAPTPVL